MNIIEFLTYRPLLIKVEGEVKECHHENCLREMMVNHYTSHGIELYKAKKIVHDYIEALNKEFGND